MKVRGKVVKMNGQVIQELTDREDIQVVEVTEAPARTAVAQRTAARDEAARGGRRVAVPVTPVVTAAAREGQEQKQQADQRGAGTRGQRSLGELGGLTDCEVVSVRRTAGTGNLKAYVDIRIGGALIIHGCAVLSGKFGQFARLPRQVNQVGSWHNVVTAADDNLRQYYQSEIMKAFEGAPSREVTHDKL